jgi:hypothetical protein
VITEHLKTCFKSFIMSSQASITVAVLVLSLYTVRTMLPFSFEKINSINNCWYFHFGSAMPVVRFQPSAGTIFKCQSKRHQVNPPPGRPATCLSQLDTCTCIIVHTLTIVYYSVSVSNMKAHNLNIIKKKNRFWHQSMHSRCRPDRTARAKLIRNAPDDLYLL